MIESMLWRFEIWKHEHLINQTFLEFEVAVQRTCDQQPTPSLPG